VNNDNGDSRAGSLLLLPGLMCDQTFWQSLPPALPRSIDCTVVDYGDAGTLTAMAEAALGGAPRSFFLAGHSMGGRVALEVARLAPSRIEKLVLMDTGYLPVAPGDKGEAERVGRLALLDIARSKGVGAMCEQWVKGMVHPDRLGDEALIASITQMFERKSPEIFARQLNALLTRPDASQVLAGLRMPCMLLCGRQDGWANPAQHEAMRALAPHAVLSVIEDAGHMVLMERPEATAGAIRQFLQ
jgi:pimeloyl-ACP methyl ester carboxylesterase